jgi:hypothetical protein
MSDGVQRIAIEDIMAAALSAAVKTLNERPDDHQAVANYSALASAAALCKLSMVGHDATAFLHQLLQSKGAMEPRVVVPTLKVQR